MTTYTHDGLNRRTLANYADTSSTTYGYDAGHRLTSVTDSLAGTISRTYDGFNRLTQEVTPQGTVSYAYDAASRRSSMTVAGQPAVGYSYDTADRLTQIMQGSASVAFSYDAAARRTSLALPNGIVVESSYDTASRLSGLTYTLGATTLGTVTYAYDASGNRSQIAGTWARTGLPASVASSSYNANNQQLSFGAATMTYDLNGNLASLTDGSGATTYTWNARDQLATLAGPSLMASFSYNGIGRRWTKTVNAARTDSLYDGLNRVQEGVLPGTVGGNLLTSLGIDEYFTWADTAEARTFLPDGLGSTLALADAAGVLSTEYTYEPFGGTTAIGAPSGSSYQYTGRENDGTGLYYYRARYYRPHLFRFISQDPIRFHGGSLNLYVYAANNPLRWRDPWGLAPGDPYPTIETAGQAAVCYYRDWSAKTGNEAGGTMYPLPGGGYTYSPNHPGGSPTTVVIAITPDAGRTYHTHPRPGSKLGPSDADVGMAGDFKIPGIIGDISSGRVVMNPPTGRKEYTELPGCDDASGGP